MWNEAKRPEKCAHNKIEVPLNGIQSSNLSCNVLVYLDTVSCSKLLALSLIF